MGQKGLKNIESLAHFHPIFIKIPKMTKNRDEPEISDAPKNWSITNPTFGNVRNLHFFSKIQL